MGKLSGARAIMVQGTASNAGKTLLAAALCRIFARMGLKVAPFKAQNMALNSYVTPDGREIGRAQALQALACGRDVDARMNPVLLKPLGNYKSQVIVMGRACGVMTFREYIDQKAGIWESVRAAYHSLAAENDIIVLEGAGSPAEINLRRHDIVNMRMAHEAGAPVLLVADIDRGGAFAALAGTMSLLADPDRKLVAGLVLNKFRGDKSLLDEALAIVEKRTGCPFVGIVPMIENLRLPEEDSVSFADYCARSTPARMGLTDTGKRLDVAIIALPAISNYTDLDSLAAERCVVPRLVRTGGEFGRPDLAILPGTRNVGAAMKFIRAEGLDEVLENYVNIHSGNLAGICGGMQLMGMAIEDPAGLECDSHMPALGFLDIITTFAPQKVLKRSRGYADKSIAGKRCPVWGYEIHHGRTRAGARAMTVLRDEGDNPIGYGTVEDGRCRVWGTYMHGIFDSLEFRGNFLKGLGGSVGETSENPGDFNPVLELDRLADVAMENMDMEAIGRIMRL